MKDKEYVKHDGKSSLAVRKRLMAIYRALFAAFGPQHWWPGDTPFEIMVGAVLTQNTAWINVEKALANIKRERLLVPSHLCDIPLRKLAILIRPSGYFNVKARRLKNLLEFIRADYGGSLKRMFAAEHGELRKKLLSVNGIGPETADSILLYGGGKPYFVVDAYTKRMFSRHGFIADGEDYEGIQRLFMKNLRRDGRLYNEYHALIVRTGKEYCKKKTRLCNSCPLRPFLS